MKYQSRTAAEVKGALYGTLLGDSTISNRGEFSCEHTTPNLIKYKQQILDQISPEIKTYTHTRDRGPTQIIRGKVYNRQVSTVIQTNQHPYFGKMRQALYGSGSKQVTPKILKHLTPEGLALWFMDDGYLDYKKSSNTRNLRICTDAFDELSIKNIQRFFLDTYGIQTKVYMHLAHANEDKRPRISFNPLNAQKFISLIYRCVLPDFYYKVDLHYAPETLNSIRCSDSYRDAVKYITTHSVRNHEDIV